MDVNQLTLGILELLLIMQGVQTIVTFVRTSRRTLQKDAGEHAAELALIKKAAEGAASNMADIKEGMARIASNAERLASLEAHLSAQDESLKMLKWMYNDMVAGKAGGWKGGRDGR